jgi:hypothetical protein
VYHRARRPTHPAPGPRRDYHLHSPSGSRGYNKVVVPANSDKPRSEPVHRHHVYAMETTGLLIIAVVLLVLILLRYWSAIHQLFR